jgi:hypothetical protein
MPRFSSRRKCLAAVGPPAMLAQASATARQLPRRPRSACATARLTPPRAAAREPEPFIPRRALLAGAAGLAIAAAAPPRRAAAFIEAPPGFRVHEDRLDGYYFFYPDDWLPVTVRGGGLGAECWHAAAARPENGAMLTLSSPSSDLWQRRLLPVAPGCG